MRLRRNGGWVVDILVSAIAATLLCGAVSCNGLKRSLIVAGSAGAGAVPGLAMGNPVLAAGGAAVSGGAASAIVERDAAEERAERLEDHLAGRPLPPPAPEPWLIERVPWWGWLVALWVWLRRAHFADALTGKEPRMDAILRALGLRTHKTPIPAKRGGGT